MTRNADATTPWYLLGAGNMGTLAASYLQAASMPLRVLRRRAATEIDGTLEKTLTFTDGRATRSLSLPVTVAGEHEPIRRLIVACKTPYSGSALAGLPLADDALVLRLQNGLGSLDGLLPASATRIEVVTTSAVKGHHPEHQVVAENRTWMGPGSPQRAVGAEAVPPAWFELLARHWPGLEWAEPIRFRQWHKLVVNAVINPLTGLYDVPNGALLDEGPLQRRMAELAAEADALLAHLDPAWPGGSLPQVEAVARATAGNTSSMRADMQRGADTEIDAINGWLLRQGDRLGIALPAHRALVAAVVDRCGG